MSDESNQLADRAKAVRELADRLEGYATSPTGIYTSLLDDQRFTGAVSDRFGGELRDTRTRLDSTADRLHAVADDLEAQARQIENTDTVFEDIADFVNGSDHTPWS